MVDGPPPSSPLGRLGVLAPQFSFVGTEKLNLVAAFAFFPPPPAFLPMAVDPPTWTPLALISRSISFASRLRSFSCRSSAV